MKPFKVFTIRTIFPSATQYVSKYGSGPFGLGRNLDLLSTSPKINRAEANAQVEDGQFPQKAAELIEKITFDAKRYRLPLVVILEAYTDLIKHYTLSPFFKNTNKLHE